MNAERLVDMANQISLFFASQASHEEAVVSVRDHIRRFWDPRMRKALAAHVTEGGAGLSDLAREAAQRLPEAAAQR